MRLFDKPQAIYTEIERMKRADRPRREDRAIVSEFFNGAPPMSDAEAEEMGLTVNVNNLFGYTQINEAKTQLFSFYTKPSRHMEVELDAAPPNKRAEWGQIAQEEARRVLAKALGFKNAYEGIAGDAALHGTGVLFMPNSTTPIGKQAALSQLLVPDETPADVNELTHFAIEGEIGLQDLHRYYDKELPGWNGANVKAVLNQIYEKVLQQGEEYDHDNAEALELRRQENSGETASSRPAAKVYYFYQKRCDKEGAPFDLTILLRRNSDAKYVNAEKAVLFEEECMFATVQDIIHPFFMDCIIGGKPMWHRTLGLGTLNYGLNYAIELLISRAMQATQEGSMNLWQANNSTTREEIQQILLKHNGVIPEGMQLVQNRFAPNFGGILEMIQFFRQQGNRNALKGTANAGDANDMLQVQFLAEQNQSASQSNNRTSNWFDYLDRYWTTVFARLSNPFITPKDAGYSMILDFQSAMERRGIPLYYLQPHNVQVRAVRIVGDGLRQKEIGIATYLTNNRSQYAPEVQPQITRMCTGLMLDNYRLAEELTPIQQQEDTPQMMRAETENSIMMTQRVPQRPKADDIDELHVLQHFPALERMIADGLQYQRGAFLPQQAEAFKVVGAHIVMHIQRIEAKAQNNRNDPEREKARAFMEQLNQMAAMGEKLSHNMQQMQSGQNAEVSPTEMAELQLKSQQLQLQRDKLQHAIEKFNRTQNVREQDTAFRQMMDLERNHREDRRDKRQGAADDTRLALEVSTAGAPQV